MTRELFRCGDLVLDLGSVVEAHWEKSRLIVRYAGGGFASLFGEQADRVWRELVRDARGVAAVGVEGVRNVEVDDVDVEQRA